MGDVVDFIMAAEAGELTEEEFVDGVHEHADVLVQLQGSWQRAVWAVLEADEEGAA